MEKKINKIGQSEETKIRPMARKDNKNKFLIYDPRKSSRIGIEAVSAIITDRAKNSREVDLISNALNKHFIFTSLSNDHRIGVISQMKLYTLNAKEPIFEQGTPGSNFYVIATGKLEVIVNNKKVNILGPGDSFGELALLHDTPRSASVYTQEKVTMWVLDRKTFRNALKTLNAQNYQENKKFIDSVPLFSVLTSTQRDSLVGELSTLKFRTNERIVKEGDPGDLFFIIADGRVECTQAGNIVREMTKGEFFGEQALLYNSMRTATVIAKTEVKCVAIGRNKLTAALGNQLQNIIYHNSKLIAFEKSKYLSKLDKTQKSKIFAKMNIENCKQESIIIQRGTLKSSRLCVVLNGALKKNRVITAQVFDCIGDESIEEESPEVYDSDIISEGETVIAYISKEDFETCIGGRSAQLYLNAEAISALRTIHILKSLPSEKFASLLNLLKVANFNDKETIIMQDSPGDSFFLINSGKVDIVKNGVTLRTVTKHDYFGERSLLFNDFRTASVIANGPVSCWYLTRLDFFNILNESLRTIFINRIELQDDSITLKDLVPVKILGKGMFGNVFLVVDKCKQRLYALKTISRKKIERYEIQENLVLERKILMALDHVLILKLVKTFKDENRIYLLTEFVNGTDLFDALRVLNLLSDKDAKFYTSCLVLILEYLHDRDIIYRDLKPENIMIDDQGYPKLIDFGISKTISGRTYTIVGTPHYMAPEVITGKGYSFPADFWSLGIMLYEFLCGGVPFGEDEQDPYIVYEKVLERRLVFPNFVEPRLPAKPVIEQLLNKNPVLRNAGSVENLKNNKWFNGLNWDSLINKLVLSPYRPRLGDLTHEVQSALRREVILENFVSEEEKIDDPNENSKRRPKNIPSLWDQDF